MTGAHVGFPGYILAYPLTPTVGPRCHVAGEFANCSLMESCMTHFLSVKMAGNENMSFRVDQLLGPWGWETSHLKNRESL